MKMNASQTHLDVAPPHPLDDLHLSKTTFTLSRPTCIALHANAILIV